MHHVDAVNGLLYDRVAGKPKMGIPIAGLGLQIPPSILSRLFPYLATVVGAVHSMDVANRPIKDSSEDFLLWDMMPPAESRHEVKVFLFCLFGQLDNFSDAWPIDGHWFLEEAMNALLHGIGKMFRPKKRR